MVHEIARRRMRNSRLTDTSFAAADEVVRWHGAMQAQDYGPAKWAIGQRAPGLVDRDVEQALAAGLVLRTHVLRPTWHFVAREDIRWLLSLTGPRVRAHRASRFRDLQLDERILDRSETSIATALKGGNQLTRNEIGEVLDRAGIDRSGQRLPYILMHCELNATICSGAIRGKQQTYALLDERAPEGHSLDRDDALAELVRRYLRSHGPATVRDLGWWSSIKVADIKDTLDMLHSEVQTETIDGVTFWSMETDEAPPPAMRKAHLLQAWDEVEVGYTESRYFGDPLAVAVREAWTDRSLPFNTALVKGRVAGHWKRTIQTHSVTVEVLLYEDPKPSDTRALKAQAAELGRFVGSEANVEIVRVP